VKDKGRKTMQIAPLPICLVSLLLLLAMTGCSSGDPATTVYVSGFAHDGVQDRDFPVLWINASYQTLPRLDPTCHGYATGVATFRGSVYVSGTSPRCSGTDAQLVVGAPVLWKDGQLIGLPTPNNNVLQAVAESVAVGQSGDVVVVGAVSSPVDISIPTPAYWENNTLSMLSMSPACGTVSNNCYNGGIATGASLQGSDLYVAGYVGYIDATGANYFVPALWKNGVFTALPTDDQNQLRASGLIRVKVTGTDVYVFGTLTAQADDSDSYPAYWKNGQLTVLRDRNGILRDGALQSGAVYAAGYYYTDQGLANPAFWQDSIMTPLSMFDPKLIGVASGIQFSGADQYISGNNWYQPDPSSNLLFGKPAFWVNGVRTDPDAPPLNGSTLANDATMTSQAPGMDLYQQWKVDAQGDPQWKNFVPYMNTNRPASTRQLISDAQSHAVTTGITVDSRLHFFAQ
jgi:hypothetical protein